RKQNKKSPGPRRVNGQAGGPTRETRHPEHPPKRAFLRHEVYIMSMPPMPPIPGAPAAAGLSSFFSATRQSVVSRGPAIDAAFCRAVLVTLAGSITPAASRSSYVPVRALLPITL